MERIVYRKTLDVHKSGVQFLLQGFETADRLSRVIEISLMASGDAIDFPLEGMTAAMYVLTPGADEPSINSCTIKDNKVVYEVLPIVEEGITTMQLKFIEGNTSGATRTLPSPKFAVEVNKSNVDDTKAEQSTTFTALENAIILAKETYDKRLVNIELSTDCIFKANYADGTYYETDVLKKLFLNGNAELSKSYAVGGTGTRTGEDTDNAKYYSNVAKTESANAKNLMENSEEILNEVRLHGTYTTFSVDFVTGEVEYVSPSFAFAIDSDSGELISTPISYTFESTIGEVIDAWLETRGMALEELTAISTAHTTEIGELKATDESYSTRLMGLETEAESVRPYAKGGTNASSLSGAKTNLGITDLEKHLYWNLDENVREIGHISRDRFFMAYSTEKTKTFNVLMINSGKINISASFSGKSHSKGYSPNVTVARVNIFLNDTLIKNINGSIPLPNSYDGRVSISFGNLNTDVDVKKGDILKIQLYMKTNVGTGGESDDFVMEEFSINANLGTPYVYNDMSKYLEITEAGN